MVRISSFLFLLSFMITLQIQSQETIDGIAGLVGKNMIKISDIESRFAQVRQQKGIEASAADRCDLLEDLLLNKLLLHKAQMDSLTVSDEEVQAQVDEQLKRMIRYYGSKENLEYQSKRTYNDIRDQYMVMVKENGLIQQAERQITDHVKVTPKEINDFFNKIPLDSIPEVEGEYEFAQIVKTPPVNSDEKERIKLELNRLRERVLKGENFATLATLYSQEPGSAKKGGELGFFSRGDMIKEFEVTAFGLKAGEVSPVIETKYGFHVIQLIEKRGDQINARHILMIPKISAEDLSKIRNLLDSVQKLIQSNKISFDEGIQQFSDEPSKKMILNPYTLNSRFTEQMAKEVLPNVNFTKMQLNEVSAPHLCKDEQNQDQYRIVMLVTKTKSHKANLVDDYDKIYNMVLQQAKFTEMLEWANHEIPFTYILISDEYKDCNFKINWLKK